MFNVCKRNKNIKIKQEIDVKAHLCPLCIECGFKILKLLHYKKITYLSKV